MRKAAIIIVAILIGILVGGAGVYLIYAYNPNKTIKSESIPISYGIYESYDLIDGNDSNVCSIEYNSKKVLSVEQIVLKEGNDAKYRVKTCYGEYEKDYKWRYYKSENETAIYLVEQNNTEEITVFEMIQSNHNSTLYVRNNKNDEVKLLHKTTNELKIESSSNQFEKKLAQGKMIVDLVNNYKKLDLLMNLYETSEKFILNENIYVEKVAEGGLNVFLKNKNVASLKGSNLSIYTVNDKVLLVGDLLFGVEEKSNGPSLVKSDNLLAFDLSGKLQYSLNNDLYNKKVYSKNNSNFYTSVTIDEKNNVNIGIEKYFVNCSNFYAQCNAADNKTNYKLDLNNLKLIKQ